jgi:uncharacterized protein
LVETNTGGLPLLGVTFPQDRDAVKAWVDGNADRDQARKVYDSLAKLPVGEGWIWAPDYDLLEHVKFPAIRTLDASKTPKAGDVRIAASVLASADLAKITPRYKLFKPHRSARPKALRRPPQSRRLCRSSPSILAYR